MPHILDIIAVAVRIGGARKLWRYPDSQKMMSDLVNPSTALLSARIVRVYGNGAAIYRRGILATSAARLIKVIDLDPQGKGDRAPRLRIVIRAFRVLLEPASNEHSGVAPASQAQANLRRYPTRIPLACRCLRQWCPFSLPL